MQCLDTSSRQQCICTQADWALRRPDQPSDHQRSTAAWFMRRQPSPWTRGRLPGRSACAAVLVRNLASTPALKPAPRHPIDR